MEILDFKIKFKDSDSILNDHTLMVLLHIKISLKSSNLVVLQTDKSFVILLILLNTCVM